MANVEILNDPHISMLAVDGNAHVFPVSMVEDFISKPNATLDRVLLQTIVMQWLNDLPGYEPK